MAVTPSARRDDGRSPGSGATVETRFDALRLPRTRCKERQRRKRTRRVPQQIRESLRDDRSGLARSPQPQYTCRPAPTTRPESALCVVVHLGVERVAARRTRPLPAIEDAPVRHHPRCSRTPIRAPVRLPWHPCSNAPLGLMRGGCGEITGRAIHDRDRVRIATEVRWPRRTGDEDRIGAWCMGGWFVLGGGDPSFAGGRS
jgi:hypothetical protein